MNYARCGNSTVLRVRKALARQGWQTHTEVDGMMQRTNSKYWMFLKCGKEATRQANCGRRLWLGPGLSGLPTPLSVSETQSARLPRAEPEMGALTHKLSGEALQGRREAGERRGGTNVLSSGVQLGPAG